MTVRDELGNPVSGGVVTGSFSGSFNETTTATTDAMGVAVLTTTATARGGVSFQFCVNDVAHATLIYDAAGNVETCDGL